MAKQASETTTVTCYRHSDRETGVSCSSCGRPICPDCMTPTPVGMRCPECSRQKTKVRTVRDLQGPPVVASVLIAICVTAFVAELVTRNQTGFESVLGRGGLRADLVADGDVWRILTAGLLHDDRLPIGLLHVGFNMYFLYFLGQLLEPTLGRLRFATAFFVSLLGGSLGALLLSPNSFTIGASGAVFGLMAVGLMELRSRGIPPLQTPLGTILILNLFITFGFAGFISVGGHLGGLVAGGLCGYLFFEVGADRTRRTPVLAACIALGVGLAIAAIVVAGSAAPQV